MKLSHENYRVACDDAFRVNICNPTVFWSATDGFYVAPSRDLVPNGNLRVGLAYYNLNMDGARSLSGSRSEYRPIAAGIRKFYATAADDRYGTLREYVDTAKSEAEFEAYRRE